MIGDCADRENRDMNVPQGDRPAIYLVATASKKSGSVRTDRQ